MKILMLVALCVSFSLATMAQSQDQSSSQSGNQATQGSQSTQGSQTQGTQDQTSTGNNQNMSGTVSHDRKNFTNDKNNKNYRVDNPDALQGQADQHVALIVHVDPDNNVIHVVQVEPQQ